MGNIDLLCRRYPQLNACRGAIEAVRDVVITAFEGGGKLLIAGNGGSAADAGHIAGELLKNFCKKRPIPEDIAAELGEEEASQLEGALPVISLPDFTSFYTAYANDRHADYGFAQLILGLGQAQDVFLALSTSGNSKNILHAIRVANAKRMKVAGLTGATGGAMCRHCAACICVPERETFAIQELHLPVYHALCREWEDYFFK
ncbi:MAG: SIS domain-containing protein [Puniceicoccales bacterium]|jgi:D-sedoheptulose 7-phosphate isomerase|nr:SIS domain-containing protein [Puniceicoccales bacterium]